MFWQAPVASRDCGVSPITTEIGAVGRDRGEGTEDAGGNDDMEKHADVEMHEDRESAFEVESECQ